MGGNGGFYHWLKLPDGLNCVDLNKRLFKKGAAILEGPGCDMGRPHSKEPDYVSPYLNMFRFSFGPLLPETFDSDIKIMKETLGVPKGLGQWHRLNDFLYAVFLCGEAILGWTLN